MASHKEEEGRTAKAGQAVCNVQWAGSNATLVKGLVVDVSDDVDLATRCLELQRLLQPLVKGKWHGEVRAWLLQPPAANQDGGSQKCQLSLTLRPGDWRLYFESVFTETPFEQETAISDAWGVLAKQSKDQTEDEAREQQQVLVSSNTLVVTTYSNPVESACGFFTGCAIKPTFSKPQIVAATVATHPQVVAAAFDDKRSWTIGGKTLSEKSRLQYMRRVSGCANRIDSEAVKNKQTAAIRTKLHVLKSIKTGTAAAAQNPEDNLVHIHGDVFSDVYHDTLTPGRIYSRNDVLERVRICGEVLLLHDRKHWHDEEIVLAALSGPHGGSFYQRFMELHGTSELFWVAASRAHSHAAFLAPARFLNNIDIRVALLYYTSWHEHVVSDIPSDYTLRKNAMIEEVRNDRSVCLAAASRATSSAALNVNYIPAEFVGDDDFVLEAVKSNLWALSLLRTRHRKNNKVFVLKCFKANWRVIFHALVQHSLTSDVIVAVVRAQLGPAKCAAEYFIYVACGLFHY